MSGDNFAADREVWLRQILSDRTLPPLAVPVALDLALRFNSKTRECFPHQDTVASAIGKNSNSVYKALRQLADAGYIRTTSPNGKRGGNTYRMVVRSDRNGSACDPSEDDEGLVYPPGRKDDRAVYPPLREDQEAAYPPVGEVNGSVNPPVGEGAILPPGRAQFSRGGGAITLEENLRKEPSAVPSSAAIEPRARSAAAVSPMSDEEMLRRLRNAASLRIEEGPGTRNLQPIQDLMAEGADFDRHIIPAVLDVVPSFSTPLRTWKAGPLVRAIRDRMVAEPEQSHDIRGVKVRESRILAVTRRYIETGIWPKETKDRWGPAPDEFGTCIPRSLLRWTPAEGPMPEVEFRGNLIPEGSLRMMVFLWQRTGAWNGAWGYEPDDPRTAVPPAFRREKLPQPAPEPNIDEDLPF